MGLQREPAARAVRRGLERVEAGRDRVRLARTDPNDPGHRGPARPGASGSGQPRRHQPVLGLGRLHHQPRDPGRGGGLEQRPHGLRFPRSGRAADEHVPVQRVQRQRQRPGRAAVPVQDLADGDRRAAGRGLLGHVEIGPQRQPDARHLALGRPAQRGHQLAARAERVGRHRVAAGRRLRRVRTFQRLPQAAGRVGVGCDRVGQAGQVGGGAHQAGHPGGGLGVGAAREQPDPPHARRDALAHLAVPQAQPARGRGAPGKPVRISGGVLLALRQFLGQLSDLGRAQRFGDEQPAERARPRGQQALLQRGGAAPVRAALVPGEQPVAYPADGPPRGQPCHQPGQRAAPQRPGSRSAGQGQEHLPALVAADQARARGEELNRAVRVVPDPADGHRAGAVAPGPRPAGARGQSPRVVRRDQGGEPLDAARIVRFGRRRGRAGFGPSRDLGDPVGVESAERVPR